MAPKLLLTAVLGCVALGTSASSKSISHELINTPYGGDNIGELPLFNPALGHLDSIDIDIFGFSSQLFDVYTMEEPSTLYMTLEGASVVFEYGGISLTASMPKVSKVYHYQPWAESYAYLYTEAETSQNYISGLAPFKGSGKVFTTPFVFVGDVSYSHEGGYIDVEDCHHCVDSRATARVTYNYSVPEPTTWAMMLMGFGAVGYRMRRRPDATLHVMKLAQPSSRRFSFSLNMAPQSASISVPRV